MPSATILPAQNSITKNRIEISRSNVLLTGVVPGETLAATVLEKSSGNKYVLAFKNSQIPATSKVPLAVGEKLVLKVESLQPQIILNIIGDKNSTGDTRINENLRQWRVNPESLLQVINKVAEFTKLLQTGNLPSAISRSDVDKLIKLFDNIILSSRTKNNPLFLKEFVSRIGLTLENSLKQLLANASKGKIDKSLEDNLKALLLKLSATVSEVLRENTKLDMEMTAKLTNILAFTGDALKAIEVKQSINSAFQLSDNGLVLQVPVALADGFRLAYILITPEDRDGQGQEKFSSCAVTIFLDLDLLGKIAVNASVRDGGFNCVIRCESEDIKDLINDNLDELKRSLAGTGYRLESICCVQEEGLMDEREEYLARQSFFAADLVNFFV
ncbi:MAG: hypothetical protein CVU52_01075 [Deltaproteobacteria bacterium HGW-Deltaproteobacteria-10]|nr:MAG: hypothetical protein CVU52_01075 [Deltaproteobacteria bacterium HGW-Deltaproteobacteria-10]